MEEPTNHDTNPSTTSDGSKLEQIQHRKQIRHIKQLTAHYTNFSNFAKKKAGQMESKESTNAKDSAPAIKCRCGLCCPNCQSSYSTSVGTHRRELDDGKTWREFTPGDTRCASAIKGDNQGSNYHKKDPTGVSPTLKLTKPLEGVVNIVNMPSQAQGQIFSKRSPCRQHSRIVTRPLPNPRPATACSERQQQKAATGWKRDVRSATIYTRYKTPELFSLIYSDLKSETVSSLDISSIHSDPEKRYAGYRYKGISLYRGNYLNIDPSVRLLAEILLADITCLLYWL